MFAFSKQIRRHAFQISRPLTQNCRIALVIKQRAEFQIDYVQIRLKGKDSVSLIYEEFKSFCVYTHSVILTLTVSGTCVNHLLFNFFDGMVYFMMPYRKIYESNVLNLGFDFCYALLKRRVHQQNHEVDITQQIIINI